MSTADVKYAEALYRKGNEKMTIDKLWGRIGNADLNPDDNPNPPGDGDPDTKLPGNDNPKPGEKTFTQAELDGIVKDRLKREKEQREKAENEARQKEEGKYKELLEAREKELDELRAEAKTSKLAAKKTELLSGAGYAPEQLEFARKNLDGETDEELAASLEALKSVFEPKTTEQIGFPNSGNGQRKPPKQADAYDSGRELAKRILGKKKQ